MRPDNLTTGTAREGIANLLPITFGQLRHAAQYRPGSVSPVAAESEPIQTEKKTMIVLGCDPGPTESGWCEFDGERVHGWGIVLNANLVPILRDARATKILAIEDMAASQRPFGNSIRDTLLWIYGLHGICAHWGNEQSLHIVTRTAVKMHLCGGLRGHGDSEVWKALVERFGKHTKKQHNPVTCVSGHARAALAAAVTVWDRLHGGGR